MDRMVVVHHTFNPSRETLSWGKKEIHTELGVVVYAYPSTWKAETHKSLMISWCTEGIPGYLELHRNSVSIVPVFYIKISREG